MAASQEQKVDFLLKKIGYVASKTGIAEDESSLSGTKKAPFGEAIPSPLVIPSTSIWSDSSEIPATPPGATSTTVQVYSTSSSKQLTYDGTVSGNRTFIARSTAGNQTASIDGDWIDPSFGADYIIKVYKGDPNSGGVQLSAAGAGSNDTWFFDYSSGVLNFNGTQVPTGITTNNVYVVGYRYIGGKGAQPTAGFATFSSVNVGGVATVGSIDVNSLTEDRVVFVGSGSTLVDNSNFTFADDVLNVTGGSSVSGVSTFGNVKISGNEIETTSGGLTLDSTSGTVTVDDDLKVVGLLTAANAYIVGNLTVEGTTTTLNTNLTEVDRLEVGANNTTVGAAITQSGTGDILNLYDGSTEVFSVEDGGRIVGTATSSVIPFLHPTLASLPSASTYHGAFAHVHSEGKGYFAHGGNWFELVNKELNGTVGTGTETYDVGAATFAGDVSIADKIIHTGDTDTAIRFPANNTFAVETAGSERLRVTSNGDVGIGVTNPGAKLHVFENDGATISSYFETNQTQTYISFKASGSSSNTANRIGVLGDDILLLTNSSEKLRITSTGSVGIGTDNPLNGLDILQGTGRTRVTSFGHIITQNRNNSTTNYWSFAPRGSGELDIGYGSPNADGTVAGDKVTITTGGNVGIATATPRQKLDVDGGVHIQENLNVVGVSTFQSNVHLGDSDKIRLGDGQDLEIYFDSNNSVIDNNTGHLYIRNNADDSDVYLLTDNSSGGSTIYVQCDGSTGEVGLRHYGTQKLATKSTGIDVTGTTDTDNLIISGTVSVGSSTGTNGQVLASTGVGVTWTTLPTARTTSTQTALEDQTTFNFTYNVGFLDVFYNGVKLANSEFTASNGSQVVLNDVAYAGDVIEFVSYSTATTGGGVGAQNLNGLADVTITGTPVIGETLTHNGTKFVNDYTATTTTTSVSQTSILSLDLSVYRSVEYQIQVTEGSKYHTTKILAIHNGTTASHNEFGTLNIGSSTATFDVDISGSNLRLLATPASSNSTVFKVKFTAIKV